jgi:hypothetical protein
MAFPFLDLHDNQSRRPGDWFKTLQKVRLDNDKVAVWFEGPEKKPGWVESGRMNASWPGLAALAGRKAAG